MFTLESRIMALRLPKSDETAVLQLVQEDLYQRSFISTIELRDLVLDLDRWIQQAPLTETKTNIEAQLSQFKYSYPISSNYLVGGRYDGACCWGRYLECNHVVGATRFSPSQFKIKQHLQLQCLSDKCKLKLSVSNYRMLNHFLRLQHQL